jgi:hypothetical protein
VGIVIFLLMLAVLLAVFDLLGAIVRGGSLTPAIDLALR